MPFAAIALKPGVDVEQTPTLNQAGVVESNLIRYREGLIEKLGGWSAFYPSAYTSPIRALHAWQGLNVDKHLAVGTETSLNVITDDASKNITPLTATTNDDPDFSTTADSAVVEIVDPNIAPSVDFSVFIATPVSVGGLIIQGQYAIATVTGSHSYTIVAAENATATVASGGDVPVFETTTGSASVTVDLADHGQSVGTTFYIFVPTTVGGVTLQGAYLVQTVLSSSAFTINAASLPTSTESKSENGGDVRFIYAIAIATAPANAGYGIGGYGDGAYGTGVPDPITDGTPITATDWSMDNWGEILLACPYGGAIYSWSPDSGFVTAKQVVGAPLISTAMFIAMPAQIVVSVGSSIDGVQDPLLVSWSDSGDFSTWTPLTTNQAGSYRLPTGSKAVGGLQGPQFSIIWTDVAVWAMEYVAPPFVFGFNKLADGCGLIARGAACVAGAAVYWMGTNQFWALDGNGVHSIPCPVWDAIFQNINLTDADKIRAAANSGFNEVQWFYCSAEGSGEPDSYVKYNYAEGEWDYGLLDRSAWIDQSVFGPPIGGSPTGMVYQHEIGYDADSEAMNPSFTTGYAVIAEGEQLAFVDFVIPDFHYAPFFKGLESFSGDFSPEFGSFPIANLQMTILVVDWPWATPKTLGPYTISQGIEYVNTRLRGRQIAFRFESNDQGSFWRGGRIRYRGAVDGRV